VAATFGCGPKLVFIPCAANVRRWKMKRERSSRLLVCRSATRGKRNIHTIPGLYGWYRPGCFFHKNLWGYVSANAGAEGNFFPGFPPEISCFTGMKLGEN
jgi:hypothetical protein